MCISICSSWGIVALDNHILPQNLTWNLKMMVSKRNHLFQGLLFRFHVKFQGCNNFMLEQVVAFLHVMRMTKSKKNIIQQQKMTRFEKTVTWNANTSKQRDQKWYLDLQRSVGKPSIFTEFSKARSEVEAMSPALEKIGIFFINKNTCLDLLTTTQCWTLKLVTSLIHF